MAEPILGVIGPWITADDVLPASISPNGTGCCGGLKPDYDPALLNKAIVFATNILFRASGRQFPGLGTRTVRPCSGVGGSGCGCGCAGGAGNGWGAGSGLAAWGGWNSFWWDTALGGWNSSYFPFGPGWACGCEGGCNGCVLPWVALSSPIAELQEVVINGEIQPLEEYAVQEYRTIVRKTLNSNNCLKGFPCQNRLSVDSSPYVGPNDGSKDHTWQIRYTYGRGPGEDGQWACAQYACELAKLWCNAADPTCRLPYRISSMVREQMTVTFIDPSLFLTNGMTGLPEVDTWVRSVSPNGNIRRSSVTRLGVPSRNLRSFT